MSNRGLAGICHNECVAARAVLSANSRRGAGQGVEVYELPFRFVRSATGRQSEFSLLQKSLVLKRLVFIILRFSCSGGVDWLHCHECHRLADSPGFGSNLPIRNHSRGLVDAGLCGLGRRNHESNAGKGCQVTVILIFEAESIERTSRPGKK